MGKTQDNPSELHNASNELFIAYQTGVIYGRLRAPASTEPFWRYTKAHREHYRRGYEEGLSATPLQKGEMFEISSMQGETVTCVKDDIEIGDPVVVLNRHGLLVIGFDNPNVFRSSVEKVNGKRKPASDHPSPIDQLKLKGLLGSFVRETVFRLVG